MSAVSTAPHDRATAVDGGRATAGVDPRTWRSGHVLTEIRVLTARSLRAMVSDPRSVVMALVMPVVMLVLFSQVFGSVIGSGSLPAGVSYIDYLIPAILVNTAMQSALQAGVGLTDDMSNGVVARLRSLPIRMTSVLVARSLSDLVRGLVQLLLMIALAALLFGFSPAGGLVGVTAALALAVVVGWSLGWVFLALATWLRNAELMQTMGMLAMFPLMFASSAFVPVSSLPTWLRVIADLNPMTYAVDAARNLALGTAVGTGALLAVGIGLLLAATGAASAAMGIRRP
jgi:ABC-2 type transport system permease protein